MQLHKPIALLCLFGLASSSPLKAADRAGLYQSHHFVSCLQYSEDRKLPAHVGRNAADELFVSGWLTAFNYLTPDTYDIVPAHDISGVMQWLDGYCRANPARGIESGLLQFTADFYAARQPYFNAPAAR
jgi:hypothetical protein